MNTYTVFVSIIRFVLLCCTITSYSNYCTVQTQIGDDCLQDSDRVSDQNWRVGCSTERSKQSLRVDVGVFNRRLCQFCSTVDGFLQWLFTLRLNYFLVTYTVLTFMCLSNLIKNGLVCIKQSLPRIRIRGTVLATSIVRSAVVIKIWIEERKYPDRGQTV